jgi:MinD-like ATPase involved in chromosome partitioning or flagellar assembly
MPDTRAVLAVALGPVPDAFRTAFFRLIPPALPPDWEVRQVGATTDDLVETIRAAGPGLDWTTLLVTPYLGGSYPLDAILAGCARAYPQLRLAVFGQRNADTARLVRRLAAHRLTNVLLDQPPPAVDDFVRLVTTDWPPDAIRPFLTGAPEEAVTAPDLLAPDTSPDAPRRVLVVLRETTRTQAQAVRTRVVAVVGGKGGVGKTSLTANLATAAARLAHTAIALDADWAKPALALRFQAPDAPLTADPRTMLLNIRQNHLAAGAIGAAFQLLPTDLADCRHLLDLCAAAPAPAGPILVPGPSRDPTLAAVPPPGLLPALVEEAAKLGAVVFVDTGLPPDPDWDDLVLQADRVVVAVTPEYEHVLEATEVLRRLTAIGIDARKVGLVVNRRGRWGLPTEDIVGVHCRWPDHPPLPLWGVVPWDPARWEASLAQHTPLALRQPRAWARLVRQVAGLTPTPAAARTRWRFGFGRASRPQEVSHDARP